VAPLRPREASAEFIAAWKESAERRSGVIAVDDSFALALITAARDSGVGVPGDLRVVGFDSLSLDQERAQLGGISFRTMAPDFVFAGDIATDLALRELRGELDRRVVYMLPVPIKP
jgi:DNA-binding LacI/PurR family transcriptional regulator